VTRFAIVLGFQLAWFATAFSAMAKRPALGLAMSALVCAAHLVFRPRRAQLVLLLVASAGVGFVADSILVALGLLTFDVLDATAPGAPLWMLMLWANLALTVDAMPAWIRARLFVLAAAGAIGGPLSYLAGERFDALHLSAPHVLSVGAVAIEWTIAMPLLVILERRIVSGPPRVDAVHVG
jgi:uncharacterized protein DUF2878